MQEEEPNQMNKENEQKKEEPEINLLYISSFENLFELLKSEKYSIKKFSKNLQKFCIESEKNNYICEKNEEYKVPTDEKTLFEKFILSKNRFDFQIFMSDLLFQFFKFLKNMKPSNKKEYNIIKNIFQIFTEVKNNNLLMDDIQCIIEYGLLNNYNNNFFIFLFDINDKNVNQFLFFFNLKNYFLSNINNINSFIFKFNELIDANNNETNKITFVKKLETILSEILKVIDIDTKNETNENKHKMKTYKEKIINLINKEKIFELFFSDSLFTSRLDILLNLFKIFTGEIDRQINFLILKNDKQITKLISKLIIKNANFIDDYINEDTLFLLNEFSIENCFSFYISRYMEGKNRLINIYNMFKDNKKIINNLVYILKNKLKKNKQAELIQQNIYNEENEYELEEKPNLENNNNKYFSLSENYKIYYISCEDDNHIKKSLDILNNLINSNIQLDEYLGIDTEWKSSPNFLDFYVENLNNSNKNKKILDTNTNTLSDIIQIAGNDFGFIFDTKSIYKSKNDDIKNKIEKLFLNSKFIGFEFQNDSLKIGDFFKKIVYKNEFIELSNVYKKIKNKNSPELKVITLEMFNKELDKRDQISDWSKRPLLSNQIKYGILDAYVLILIFKKLNEKNI